MPPLRITPRQAAMVALFAGLTAVGAFVRIPLPGVPLTLQTAAVLMSGIVLGSRMGALSQAVYVVTGLVGLPVFAQGGGPGYVLNPTFGYLCGFVGGSAVAGLLSGDWRGSSSWRLLGAMLAGLTVIYIVGVAYLYWNLLFFQGKEISINYIARIGFLIPLPLDLGKVLFLLLIIKTLGKRLPYLPVENGRRK